MRNQPMDRENWRVILLLAKQISCQSTVNIISVQSLIMIAAVDCIVLVEKFPLRCGLLFSHLLLLLLL